MEKNVDYDLKSVQEARDLSKLGKIASESIATFSEKQIDKIIKNIVLKIRQNAIKLAEMAVKETGFGNVRDKTYKNHMASVLLYDEIKFIKTIGIIDEDKENKILTIAEPMGLLLGIIPSTNPTSTVIFKSIIAIKSRNAILFSPHPSALLSTLEATRIIQEAAKEAGAPDNVVTCITNPSIQATKELMKCDEVKLIVATGGSALVKLAYSSGKPTLGVGAGNTPVYIEKTANIEKAVKNIIASKTFDNGTICASEQSIIVEKCIKDEVIRAFEENGGYFMSPEETIKVCKTIFNNDLQMNPKFVGKSAIYIAKNSNIEVPSNTKVLLGIQYGVGNEYPLSYEKLNTVLGFYVVENCKEACDLSVSLLEYGMGHTMSLHTEDENIVFEFSKKPASRILINTGSSMGATGVSTGLQTSFTLGCGTLGGSSISENVGPIQLINIKKIAYGIKTIETLIDDDKSFDYFSDINKNENLLNKNKLSDELSEKLNDFMKSSMMLDVAKDIFKNSNNTNCCEIKNNINDVKDKEKSHLSGCNKCVTGSNTEIMESIIKESKENGELDSILNEGINQKQLDDIVNTFSDLLNI